MTTTHQRKQHLSSALPAWCIGRRPGTNTHKMDIDLDPEAKSSKPSRERGGGGGGGTLSSSPKHASMTDPVAKLNRDPEHVRGTRKARLFLICLPIGLIFLMILRPLYAPFIDVFGGDLLDQLLASEEGQGHVSAVSVSDDFLSEHWPVEASGTAAEKHTSTHVSAHSSSGSSSGSSSSREKENREKKKKKSEEYRNRKMLFSDFSSNR